MRLVAMSAGLLLWPVMLWADVDLPETITQDMVHGAMTRGVDFLVRDQNGDGSWGGPHDSITTWSGEMWPNPESHRAWKVATTGLCCAALLEVDPDGAGGPAADLAVRYLLDNADVKRANEWDTMNCWAYIYGLQGLAVAYGHARYAESPLRAEMAAVIPEYLDRLSKAQSVLGGWGYLELDPPRTRRTQWATSFTTAAAVVAMAEAKRQGFEVDEAMLSRAVRIIDHSRLPNGGYSYHVRAIPYLGLEYIDQIKGSLCRISSCQAALIAGGSEVPLDDIRTGLKHFFREHVFIDIARGKPIPHEAYYANSGYFYLFGHYYAALVIEQLPAEERSTWWPKLQHEIIKLQQRDGSIWDYDMHRYDKPYGVAFGLMTLVRSVPAASPAGTASATSDAPIPTRKPQPKLGRAGLCDKKDRARGEIR